MNNPDAISNSANITEDDFQIRLNRLRNFKNLPEQEYNILYSGENVVSSSLWNLDKKQDFVWEAIQNGILYSIVADGHGKSVVVNWLKSKSDEYFISICDETKPTETLEKHLLEEAHTFDSGACISIIRTNMNTNVEVFNLGDTMTQIYKNGEKIAQSESHNWNNLSEYERKINEGATFSNELMMARLPEITNNPHITMIKGQRCNHTSSTNLQITRAMGHSGNTGSNYGYLSIDFARDDDIKIITASDGVWDVVHENESLATYSTAAELVNFAAHRWCANWNYVHHDNHTCSKCKCKKPNEQIISLQKGISPDDISVSIIHLPQIVEVG